MHGFSAFTVIGHSRSRPFSPEIGGINFGTAYAPVARPDHDQGFQQTTNLQYQFSLKELRGLWLGLTWRFDSGLVVVSLPDYATALTLTADQQQAIGLYCGNIFATVAQPLQTCNAPQRHTFAVELLKKGIPTRRVQMALGHKSVQVTEHYYAKWCKSQQEALDKDLETAWE